ncbi:prolyl oligopeptidase family serine peptidase [uncultured Marinobacter sp.]|uniref:prolyl oligopeptidase family serine peptidase n=1 Tax=uncultured Marinobacter sp. TaxID=187379 RepID=UPI0026200ECA|nr:prolyl oligopeptidase family serine peptidase [uncultured Marinobacter sp.]
MNNNKNALIMALSVALAACGGGNSDVSDPPDTGPSDVASEIAEKSAPDCFKNSWVAGTTELCNGTLVYYDYIYDDYGADNGLISLDPTLLNVLNRGGSAGQPVANTPGLLSPTAGDQRYPQGLENTADLVRLTLEIDGNRLLIQAELNTLINPNDAILGVAIDSDGDSTSGGGHWGDLDIRSDGWDHLFVSDDGDPETNLIEIEADLPAGEQWRIQAAVAQPDGTVMNVAYRGRQEQAKADGGPNQFLSGSGNFWEDNQAQVLATGDITPFSETVDVMDLRRGATREQPAATGFHQRVYTSHYPLGEGISIPGEPGRDGGGTFCGQSFNYLGKYQPYGVYVPEQVTSEDQPPGLMVVMHGCEANHASQINQSNMQRQFADNLNRIMVAPLGRGPYGFYTGASERDVLDVMADISSAHTIDEERVFASGYSMGGFGALHMATHYPDKFAGMVNWVGHTGDLLNLPSAEPTVDKLLSDAGDTLLRPVISSLLGSIADPKTGTENVIDYLGNLRHVPSAHLYAGADELVQIQQALAIASRLAATPGIDYEFYLHPVAEHLTFLFFDDWAKEAELSADWVRVSNPSRVSYLFDPRFDYPELDIVHDRAYWISELRAREALPAQVDLHSLGCGDAEVVFETGADVGESPTPWASNFRHQSGEQPVSAIPVLNGTLTNVGSATLDLDAACLAGMPVEYSIESDGPANLKMSDGRVLDLVAGQNEGVF